MNFFFFLCYLILSFYLLKSKCNELDENNSNETFNETISNNTELDNETDINETEI